jgi:predicted regulator of amino acid metabolism with ACT domain
MLNDGDLEFVFALYDSAKVIMAEKDRPTWAEEVVRHLVDFGIDVKQSAPDLSDHCELIEAAIAEYLEVENEDIDLYGEYNEDDEEYEY